MVTLSPLRMAICSSGSATMLRIRDISKSGCIAVSKSGRSPRTIWAVQHTKLFDKPKEAWEYYQSSKQRYYEWKACMLPNDLLVNAATQLPVHVIG